MNSTTNLNLQNSNTCQVKGEAQLYPITEHINKQYDIQQTQNVGIEIFKKVNEQSKIGNKFLETTIEATVNNDFKSIIKKFANNLLAVPVQLLLSQVKTFPLFSKNAIIKQTFEISSPVIKNIISDVVKMCFIEQRNPEILSILISGIQQEYEKFATAAIIDQIVTPSQSPLNDSIYYTVLNNEVCNTIKSFASLFISVFMNNNMKDSYSTQSVKAFAKSVTNTIAKFKADK